MNLTFSLFLLQVEIEEIVKIAWQFFQPFLFGLIGAEISIVTLGPETVGESVSKNCITEG